MGLSNPDQVAASIVTGVHGWERWPAYQRLQELAVPCCCAANEPLQVEISSIAIAVQFWSVLKCLNSDRQDLVGWLNQCWNLSN